jgi:hypothetical protein
MQPLDGRQPHDKPLTCQLFLPALLFEATRETSKQVQTEDHCVRRDGPYLPIGRLPQRASRADSDRQH